MTKYLPSSVSTYQRNKSLKELYLKLYSLRACMCACVHACVRVNVCMYVCVHACACVSKHRHGTYVNIHMCVYLRTYINELIYYGCVSHLIVIAW